MASSRRVPAVLGSKRLPQRYTSRGTLAGRLRHLSYKRDLWLLTSWVYENLQAMRIRSATSIDLSKESPGASFSERASLGPLPMLMSHTGFLNLLSLSGPRRPDGQDGREPPDRTASWQRRHRPRRCGGTGPR